MAAAGRAEPECLEEEGCREEVLVFGFVDVAECFAKVVSERWPCASSGGT